MIPHIDYFLLEPSSVDATADLPRTQCRGFEPQRAEFVGNQRKDTVVAVALTLELGVPRPNVLVDCRVEAVEHFFQGAFRSVRRQPENLLEPPRRLLQHLLHEEQSGTVGPNAPHLCPKSGRPAIYLEVAS